MLFINKKGNREGEELFKLTDNVGKRTNGHKLGMNKFRLATRKKFLSEEFSEQLSNMNSEGKKSSWLQDGVWQIYERLQDATAGDRIN